MTIKSQKLISSALVSITAFGGFEILLVILNLNQVSIYLHTAFWIYVYLLLSIAILFDLHFKNPGAIKRAMVKHQAVTFWLHKGYKVLFTALWDRMNHLRTWKYVRQLLLYLLMPGFVYWGTIILFYVNFGNDKIQQIFVLLSGAALVANFWYLKEAFHRRREVVDSDIFITLTVVKIYSSAVLFAASLAMVRRYCLDAKYFLLAVFCFTFLLMYQALAQHRLTTIKNIAITLVISVIMAHLGYLILIYWGYDFYTAAVFWTAFYNLLWGLFHYHLDRALTKVAFFEILLITLLIAGMVFSVTNFRAQLLDGCQYYFL